MPEPTDVPAAAAREINFSDIAAEFGVRIHRSEELSGTMGKFGCKIPGTSMWVWEVYPEGLRDEIIKGIRMRDDAEEAEARRRTEASNSALRSGPGGAATP